MGFDVTYHPVHPSEVAHYVVEPLAEPALREERLQQLTIHKGFRDSLASSVFCSGAYVAPARIAELEAYLKKSARDPAFKTDWGDPAPLAQALKYAKQHGLGLLEATEIVDANSTASFPENLRADYKRNLKKANNMAHGRLVRATRAALVTAVRQHWADIEAERFDVAIEPDWQPELEPDVLRLLAQHCTSARTLLARSTSTAPELLEHMAFGPKPRDETDIERSYVLVRAVENPSLPVGAMPKLLAMVSKSKKPLSGVLFALACNPSSPADVLEQILAVPRQAGARVAIAKHPNATSAMLSKLAGDSLKQARLAARSHPNYRPGS